MLPPLFLDMVSSCTADWSGIHYVDQASLVESCPGLPPKCCYEKCMSPHMARSASLKKQIFWY